MIKSFEDAIRRFSKLYSSALSLREIEGLIKRDAPGIYEFYLRDVKQAGRDAHPFSRGVNFVGSLFMAFLLKLTPARRMFYSLALFVFIYGFLVGSWIWGVLGFLALNLLLAFELADKLTARDDLEVAREIQMGLMPRNAPEDTPFDIACYSEAAREVGGDYYDFIQPAQPADTTLIVIGDVSGKGMGAALYMVQVKAILRNLISQHERPHEILTTLNTQLKQILRQGSFFTVSIASVNAKPELTLCRAGHMPLIHYQHECKTCREVVPGGIGIGLPDHGRFAELLEETTVPFAPGDVLLFYTDGLVETMNTSKVEFDDFRLKQLIEANAAKPAREIQNAILSALARFRGAAPPLDDITLIVMKVK